jgi:hypothetical protein
VDSDGLGNWAASDVHPESNGRRPCFFNDAIAVHTAAPGAQGVELPILRPRRQPFRHRSVPTGMNGYALGVCLDQAILADGITAHAGDCGDIMTRHIGCFCIHDGLPVLEGMICS